MAEKLIIYHNTRCAKSRAGLKYLADNKLDHEVVEYLKNPLSPDILRRILMKMNKQPHEIVRKQENYYKKELKGKQFNDDEWIIILLENPKLLERPIVEGKYKAVLAQPPEEIEKIG
ncbi:MAG: ArsC/Spx/MgsR family protein [Bacteroidales bacterium]